MLKRLFLAALAALFVVVGCDKPENNTGDGTATAADLVGSWEANGEVAYVFKADGTYEETTWRDTVSGTWSLDGGKLACTPSSGKAWETDYVLTGGKAWLVFIVEGGEGERHFRAFENYRKVGAKVESGKLSDGRWDAPRTGVKPQECTDSTDYTMCMIISGTKVDLYIPAWGLRIQGTYTLADGRMHIETDDDHIWKALYFAVIGELNYSYGWNSWGSPLDDDKDWDVTCGGMFAERLTLQKVYKWYSVTEILAMGEDPDKAPANADKDEFKYKVYESGKGYREEAQDLCDFDLCVTADGKEAYGGAVGLSPWLYKR